MLRTWAEMSQLYAQGYRWVISIRNKGAIILFALEQRMFSFLLLFHLGL